MEFKLCLLAFPIQLCQNNGAKPPKKSEANHSTVKCKKSTSRASNHSGDGTMPGERKVGWKFGINLWPFSIERSTERTVDDEKNHVLERSTEQTFTDEKKASRDILKSFKTFTSQPVQTEQRLLFPSEITCHRFIRPSSNGTGRGHEISFKLNLCHSIQITAWPCTRAKWTEDSHNGKVILETKHSFDKKESPSADRYSISVEKVLLDKFVLVDNYEKVKTAKSEGDNTFGFSIEEHPARLSYWVNSRWNSNSCELPFSHLRLEVGSWVIFDKSNPE